MHAWKYYSYVAWSVVMKSEGGGKAWAASKWKTDLLEGDWKETNNNVVISPMKWRGWRRKKHYWWWKMMKVMSSNRVNLNNQSKQAGWNRLLIKTSSWIWRTRTILGEREGVENGRRRRRKKAWWWYGK